MSGRLPADADNDEEPAPRASHLSSKPPPRLLRKSLTSKAKSLVASRRRFTNAKTLHLEVPAELRAPMAALLAAMSKDLLAIQAKFKRLRPVPSNKRIII